MEESKKHNDEAILNFKGITEVKNSNIAINYLKANGWDVSVFHTNP